MSTIFTIVLFSGSPVLIMIKADSRAASFLLFVPYVS